MKRIMMIFSVFLFSIYVLCSLEFTVLHTNDHHGSTLSVMWGDYEVAGLEVRAYLIEQHRTENTLLLDAGDLNTGQTISNSFAAEPDIKSYNIIGYDAMALGNHEFYGGLGRLRRQMRWAEFPFLSANIFHREQVAGSDIEGGFSIDWDGDDDIGSVSLYSAFRPFIIKTLPNGLRVAILGLTTTLKEFSDEVIVIDEVRIANYLVPRLREEADVVIALTHLGIYDVGNDSPYESGYVGSLRLAMEVEGIDLIIDGDSHTLLEEPLIVNGTPILQAGHRGRYLGKASAFFDPDTAEFTLLSWECIPLYFGRNRNPLLRNQSETSTAVKELLDGFISD